MISKTIIIGNNSGIDIKLAGAISRKLQAFKCESFIILNGSKYNARSILSIVSASIRPKDVVEFICNGDDEEACMKELETSIMDNLI